MASSGNQYKYVHTEIELESTKTEITNESS